MVKVATVEDLMLERVNDVFLLADRRLHRAGLDRKKMYHIISMKRWREREREREEGRNGHISKSIATTSYCITFNTFNSLHYSDC